MFLFQKLKEIRFLINKMIFLGKRQARVTLDPSVDGGKLNFPVTGRQQYKHSIPAISAASQGQISPSPIGCHPFSSGIAQLVGGDVFLAH